MTEFVIGPSERVLIVGRTRSGKSTLARALFNSSRRLVVIDSKWEEDVPYATIVYTPADFRRLWPQRTARVVFRPDPTAKRAADVDEVLARVLAARQARIVVHEAVDLAPATWILPALRRAIKTGGSLGVGVTICSQRPIGLHNDAISEFEHVFVFDLALEGDRNKVAGVAGDEARERVGAPYAFLYSGPATGGRMIRCPPLRLPTGPRPTVEQSTAGGTDSWSGRRSATSSPSR